MARKIIIFLVLSMVFISACSILKKDMQKEVKEMTKELCESSKGNWNECSSPCLGTDAEACIQVCVAQCECGGIAEFNCPFGYKCRLTVKITDEMGVCVK